MKNFIAVIGLLLLGGCAMQVTPEMRAAGDYGAAPTNYQAKIKSAFYKALIDPTSPLYDFERPKKGYTRQDMAGNPRLAFGWLVCGKINSKNRMGGYTGWVPFFTFFKNGELLDYMVGQIPSSDPYALNLTNSQIVNVCTR